MLVLGDLRFPSKASAKRAIKQILNNATIDGFLPAAEFAVVADLIKRHPNATDKIGSGIQAIRVSLCPPYNTRAFWIHRTDGTQADLSYLRCLDQTHRECVMAALRNVVRSQIASFKHSVPLPSKCPLTGSLLDIHTCEVDHDEPPFVVLVERWIESVNLTIDDVLLKAEFSATGPELMSGDQARSFFDYHKSHAHLRLLSAEGHRLAHRTAGLR